MAHSVRCFFDDSPPSLQFVTVIYDDLWWFMTIYDDLWFMMNYDVLPLTEARFICFLSVRYGLRGSAWLRDKVLASAVPRPPGLIVGCCCRCSDICNIADPKIGSKRRWFVRNQVQWCFFLSLLFVCSLWVQKCSEIVQSKGMQNEASG